MKNLATIFFFVFLFSNNQVILASDKVQPKDNKGSFFLEQILIAHETIANSKSSKLVNRQIPGSIILIEEKKYEIVSFAFEDTAGNLPDETFSQYAKRNNLHGMRSQIVTPLKGIKFEVFDSSNAHLDDEVYFNITLREIKQED
jgi:hypothetical protein